MKQVRGARCEVRGVWRWESCGMLATSNLFTHDPSYLVPRTPHRRLHPPLPSLVSAIFSSPLRPLTPPQPPRRRGIQQQQGVLLAGE